MQYSWTASENQNGGTSIADYDEAGNRIKRYESTAYGEGNLQEDTTGSAYFSDLHELKKF